MFVRRRFITSNSPINQNLNAKKKESQCDSIFLYLFLFYRAKAFSAAMGAFGNALAVHVYADGEIVPLWFDFGLAFGANVGS